MSLSESQLREAFQLYDMDGDGKITLQELGMVIRSSGKNPTQAELQRILKDCDADNNGCIDFREFERLNNRGAFRDTVTADQMKEALRIFDTDNSGFIAVPELRQVTTALGEKLTTEEADEIISDMTINADGKVNYEELVYMLLNKKFT